MNLLQNPFHLLAATPRDNPQRITELFDERSLLIESGELAQARSDLTNPRKRLSSEVAWLPGLSPQQAKNVMSWLCEPVQALPPLRGLGASSPLARANILACGLEMLTEHKSSSAAEWILALASAFEEIVPGELLRDINEERVVAGFPEVKDLSVVEAELQERRRHYRQSIKSALDHLLPKELVEAMTTVVGVATENGEKQGPILVDDLVDSFEVEAQAFLEKEEGNIKALVEKLWAAADAGSPDSALTSMVNQLVQVVSNWDLVAQPIQVSAKSRGLAHSPSHRVAGLVRGLAIHLFNKHGKLDVSRRLTKLLQDVFAEVGEILECTDEDARALVQIAERRELRRLLDPILELCRTAREESEKGPILADKEAKKVMDGAPRLVSHLMAVQLPTGVLAEGRDEIALTLVHCAVVYGNETKDWEQCVSILEEALGYASSGDVRSRIHRDLQTVRDNERRFRGLKPISSAPSLNTVNGCGFTLYGSTDHDRETGSYLSTYYFVFFGIPLFPTCRYRVIPTAGGYRFLGKASLRTFDKWHIAVFVGLVLWFLMSL